MHTGRPRRYRHIEAVVHDNACITRFICCTKRLARNRQQFARWKILLANLHKIYSCGDGGTNTLKYRHATGIRQRFSVGNIESERSCAINRLISGVHVTTTIEIQLPLGIAGGLRRKAPIESNTFMNPSPEMAPRTKGFFTTVPSAGYW